MSMETALRARLMADAAISAIVGNRVDWSNRPSANAYPALTMMVVSDVRDQRMKAFQALTRPRVQFDCMALTAGEKVALREAVIACLAPRATVGGVKFEPVTGVNIVDAGEDKPGVGFIHRDSVDAIIWHKVET